jgi:hypothetical protein
MSCLPPEVEKEVEMSNVGRVLTLVVEIVDDNESKDIWVCHGMSRPLSGFKITGIHEGDATIDESRSEPTDKGFETQGRDCEKHNYTSGRKCLECGHFSEN